MISVCMPYYQRQSMLDASLEAYRRLYTGIEISICDDGSPDPVVAPDCRVVTLPKKAHALNPCTAINAAVANSTGDIVVLTNPEILHLTPVLYGMRSVLETMGESGYVTASCWDHRGRWIAHSSLKGGMNGRGPMPAGSQFHHCAMFYRSLWDKAQGFDEDYRDGSHFDDNDWLWRAHQAGAVFRHMDSLIVYHTPTNTKWPEGGWQRNAELFREKWCSESLSA